MAHLTNRDVTEDTVDAFVDQIAQKWIARGKPVSDNFLATTRKHAERMAKVNQRHKAAALAKAEKATLDTA